MKVGLYNDLTKQTEAVGLGMPVCFWSIALSILPLTQRLDLAIMSNKDLWKPAPGM